MKPAKSWVVQLLKSEVMVRPEEEDKNRFSHRESDVPGRCSLEDFKETD